MKWLAALLTILVLIMVAVVISLPFWGNSPEEILATCNKNKSPKSRPLPRPLPIVTPVSESESESESELMQPCDECSRKVDSTNGYARLYKALECGTELVSDGNATTDVVDSTWFADSLVILYKDGTMSFGYRTVESDLFDADQLFTLGDKLYARKCKDLHRMICLTETEVKFEKLCGIKADYVSNTNHPDNAWVQYGDCGTVYGCGDPCM